MVFRWRARFPGRPDFPDYRQAYVMMRIATGHVLDAMFPSKAFDHIDSLLSVTSSFPPTVIVHGEQYNIVIDGLDVSGLLDIEHSEKEI